MEERHRHRFEVRAIPLPQPPPPPERAPALTSECSSAQVNPELKSHFEDKGFRFVGQDIEGERMEVIELDGTEPDLNQSSDNRGLSAHL